jgi:predicted lipid-binding transport protein (Tim44 family)
MTPNRGPASPSYGYGGYGSRFGGGFGRGFFGGLLGAGLLGLLFGHSFFGFGGFGSFFGLLIQLALIFFLVRLAMRWFASAQPGFAGGSQRAGLGGAFAPGGFGASPAPGGFGASPAPGGFGASPAPGASGGAPIALRPEDYSAFEWLLQESQTAFGAEDLDRVRSVSTPEMASYFAEQLAQNARRGLVNKIADVRLVRGDLSEAWREPAGEFATVSMRIALLDWTVERDSGRVVEGDPRSPQEATEYWTFRREVGGGPRDWRISAIQQAA